MDAQDITQLRKRKHWSKSELARQLGVTYKAVRMWENGLSHPSPMAQKLLRKIEADNNAGRENV